MRDIRKFGIVNTFQFGALLGVKVGGWVGWVGCFCIDLAVPADDVQQSTVNSQRGSWFTRRPARYRTDTALRQPAQKNQLCSRGNAPTEHCSALAGQSLPGGVCWHCLIVVASAIKAVLAWPICQLPHLTDVQVSDNTLILTPPPNLPPSFCPTHFLPPPPSPPTPPGTTCS